MTLPLESPREREAALLGVERSLLGRRWQLHPVDERLSLALSQRHELPEMVGRILAARGVAVDAAESYLDPTLRSLMPDPSVLKDMDRAADRIARAAGRFVYGRDGTGLPDAVIARAVEAKETLAVAESCNFVRNPNQRNLPRCAPI